MKRRLSEGKLLKALNPMKIGDIFNFEFESCFVPVMILFEFVRVSRLTSNTWGV